MRGPRVEHAAGAIVREAKRDEERGSAGGGWLDASCGDRSLVTLMVSARPGIPGWACTEYIPT